MGFIISGNLKLYYQSHGVGEPIIFISGYCSDHQFWKLYTEKLSKQYQVIVFDNRAVGQTEDDGGLLSVQLMADDVAALISKLKLDKPHIIGMSMGGTIAQYLAANYRFYLSVHDFCDGVVKIINKGKSNEIYNIASNKCYNVKDVVKIRGGVLRWRSTDTPSNQTCASHAALLEPLPYLTSIVPVVEGNTF